MCNAVSMNSFLVRDTNLLSTHRTGLYSVPCSWSGSWAMTLNVVPLAETLVSTGTVTGTVTKLPPATRTPWPLASSSSFAVGIPLVSEMSGKTTVAEELRSSSIFPPARISSKRRSPAKLNGTQCRAGSTARPRNFGRTALITQAERVGLLAIIVFIMRYAIKWLMASGLLPLPF
jgi:hypothetical protein